MIESYVLLGLELADVKDLERRADLQMPRLRVRRAGDAGIKLKVEKNVRWYVTAVDKSRIELWLKKIKQRAQIETLLQVSKTNAERTLKSVSNLASQVGEEAWRHRNCWSCLWKRRTEFKDVGRP